jgi:hypothetical protein
MHQAVSQGDREHRVVGEPAEGVKKGELDRLDRLFLVDRADDVAGDGSQHVRFPCSRPWTIFRRPNEWIAPPFNWRLPIG